MIKRIVIQYGISALEPQVLAGYTSIKVAYFSLAIFMSLLFLNLACSSVGVVIPEHK